MNAAARAFVTILLVFSVKAIYEDQAGQQDWHKENIGRVRLVTFSKLPGVRQREAYVATASNVIAALNLRTGSTVWRQVLADNEAIDQLVNAGEGLVTLSQNGAVRVWMTEDGSLSWDEHLEPAKRAGAQSEVAVFSDSSSATSDVAVLHDDRVQMRDARNGRLRWTWNGANGEELLRMAESESSEVLVLGRDSKGALTVHRLDASSGKLAGSKAVKDIKLTAGVVPQVAGQTVIVTDKCALVVHRMGETTKSYPLGQGVLKAADCKAVVKAQELDGTFIITSGASSMVVSVASDLALTVSHTYSSKEACAVAKDRDGATHVVTASTQQDGTLITHKSAQDDTQTQVPTLSEELVGGIDAVFLNVFMKQDGTPGTRTLVSSADHGLTLIQKGVAVWRREEALATIQHVEFVDLPYQAEDSEDPTKFAADLMAKLSGQATANAARSHVRNYAVKEASTTALYTDKFGIRKLAIVSTSSNKVYAINTETSEIVWQKLFPVSEGVIKRLFLVRKTGSLPPECIAVSIAGSKTTFNSFNPHSGKIVTESSLPFAAQHVVALPDKDSEHRRILMVINRNAREVVAYPSSKEAHAALAAHLKEFFWHDVDKAANTVTGYRVVEKGDKFFSEQLWQVSFPSSERIDAIAARSLEETIFSPMHVTGNHDVMRKYINPNLLAISTVSDHVPFFKGTKAGSTGTSATNPSVHMYCVDTITGHVLYHVAHPQSTGPTHLALSENWAVHTYWSDRHLRTELSVVELWEDDRNIEDMTTLVLRGLGLAEKPPSNKFVKRKHFSTGVDEGQKFSSFQQSNPQKEEQSFVFPLSVKVLAVSSTDLGITSKDLLVGTSTNQLYALPRKFFDARRPMKQATEADMEEGLVQYHPVLPLIPTNILSYNQSVAGLRGIRAVPAGGLESTSLVLAYGIDMFFCRSAPSKTFDMLPDDFQYGILLLTIAGLSVATMAATMASKRKDLNLLWR
jgi:outer membrane protein assembly factor BamB